MAEQDITGKLPYESIISYIRTAIYGKNVREAIAQGIEHCHEKYENAPRAASVSKNSSTGVVTISITQGDGTVSSATVTDTASLIKDSTTATNMIWSSSKISSELDSVAMYEKIEISSLSASPATAEVGSTVSSVALSYALTKAAKTIKVNNASVSNTAASGTITRTGTWTGSTPQTKHDFVLSVTDERNWTAPTKTASLVFQNQVYYGAASVPSTLNSAFVTGLTKVFDGNTRKRTVSVTAGSGKYIYYAVPTRLGTCTFTVGGFTGGFTLAGTVSVTNSSGYAENYYVYKSDNANLGSTSVVVS